MREIVRGAVEACQSIMIDFGLKSSHRSLYSDVGDNQLSMKAVAVDLGGTHVAYGIVEDRTLLFHDLFDSAQAKSLSSVLATLEHELQRSQERFGACAGMAIDLPEWCRTRLGLNLRIENDARMALLGEHYAGAGHGEEDLVMMTLGTGIGTAALLQGRMLRGTHFHAACL